MRAHAHAPCVRTHTRLRHVVRGRHGTERRSRFDVDNLRNKRALSSPSCLRPGMNHARKRLPSRTHARRPPTFKQRVCQGKTSSGRIEAGRRWVGTLIHTANQEILHRDCARWLGGSNCVDDSYSKLKNLRQSEEFCIECIGIASSSTKIGLLP
eukprot:5498466-Pleurochrysis_carterae.AAC.1